MGTWPLWAWRDFAGEPEAWIDPPRLPIPDLSDTCRRYVEIAESLIDGAELTATRKAAAEFEIGHGPALQQDLLSWEAHSDTSYVHGFWRDLYLRHRGPLPIEQNVAGGSALPDWARRVPLPHRAALVALTTMEFLLLGAAGRLPQDIEHRQPLCMRQYRDLCGTARLPGDSIDEIRRPPRVPPTYCVVAWREAYFPLVLWDAGTLRAAGSVTAELDAILRTDQRGPSVGWLTTTARDEWAALRRTLASVNRISLATIEGAAFLLCIDDGEPTDRADQAAAWLVPSSNRWFDKTLQVILSSGPHIGCNIEHSNIDGFTVGRLAQYITSSLESRREQARSADALPSAQPLPWNLPRSLQHRIAELAASVSGAAAGLRIECFDVEGCPAGVRGDIAVQLALQLAYREVTGRLDSVYQPVHTRRYRAGRTEAVRPVTVSSRRFCEMAALGASAEELAPAARRALRDIAARTSDSRNGRGIDRHLFALYNLAGAQGRAVQFFEDPSYFRLLGPAILCTSSVAAVADQLNFSFGPVRPDGFAVAYSLASDRIRFCLTAWRSDLGDFCQAIARALPRIVRLSTLVSA